MTETFDPAEYPIRVATPDDFIELMRRCIELHSENGQHPLSEEKLQSLIWRGVTRQNAIIGVIGAPHDIRAMIYLQIDPIYYSDDFQLLELFNYVRPDSRRSDFAKRLIGFAKRCAEETGFDLLIGIISEKRLEAKARLYERHLEKGGAFYLHRARRDAVAAE